MTDLPFRARRLFLEVVGAALAASAASLASAQAYPSKPITLVVPFAAGGITDSSARLVARKLGEELKQPVVVDNKAGAGGSVGSKVVAAAAPDGYTLLLGTMATHVVNAFVYGQALGYDPLKDFSSVSGIMAVPVVIVTRPDKPYRTMAALVDAARAKPGSISYGSPGAGTVAHLAAELMGNVTRASLLHVPYKGSAPVITDLLGGNLDVAFDYASTTAAHIQSGKLVPLAVTGPTRLPGLPQVPTLREAGFPEAEVTSWIAIFAPAATQPAALDRLRQAMEKVMRDPETVEGIAKLGGQPLPMPSAALGEHVRAEYARWKPVVEKAGIKPN